MDHQPPVTATVRSKQICHELHGLAREEAAMQRISRTHLRFLNAIDWTAMTPADRLRITHRGQAIEQQLHRLGHAIDQRIFELVHEDDESLGVPPLANLHATVAALAELTNRQTSGSNNEPMPADSRTPASR